MSSSSLSSSFAVDTSCHYDISDDSTSSKQQEQQEDHQQYSKTIQKSVSFATNLRAKRILHLNDYTPNEYKASFYSREEYRKFKHDGVITSELLLEHGFSAIGGGDGYGAGRNQMEFCARGVEFLSKEGMLERSTKRKSVCLIVLEEQARIRQQQRRQQEQEQRLNKNATSTTGTLSPQHESESNNDNHDLPATATATAAGVAVLSSPEERIAKVYSKAVADSVSYAYQVGLADEEELQSILQEEYEEEEEEAAAQLQQQEQQQHYKHSSSCTSMGGVVAKHKNKNKLGSYAYFLLSPRRLKKQGNLNNISRLVRSTPTPAL